MAELVIKIAPDGQTSLNVEGAHGPSCKDITKGLEDALGVITASGRKPEYNDCSEAGCSTSGM